MAKDQACREDSEEPEPRSGREAVFVAIREKNCAGCPQMSQDRPWGAGYGNDKALHRQELPGNAV